MDLKLQRIAAWGGIAMLALFFVFFMLVAGLIPPLSPTLSAQQVTDFLIANKVRVRVGVAFTLLAACVALPWLATICLRVRRVEGKWGVLSVTQIFGGVIFVPGFLFPLMVLAAAAFRPEERDPQITQTLNDVFWLMFVGIVGTLIVQALVRLPQCVVRTPGATGWCGDDLQRRPAGVERRLRLLGSAGGLLGLDDRRDRGVAPVDQGRAGSGVGGRRDGVTVRKDRRTSRGSGGDHLERHLHHALLVDAASPTGGGRDLVAEICV
jgi:hypothetical protein